MKNKVFKNRRCYNENEKIIYQEENIIFLKKVLHFQVSNVYQRKYYIKQKVLFI